MTGAFGTYTVCFPRIDVFDVSCAQYADFEFSENSRLSRFTIYGQPVEQLYRPADYDRRSTAEDSPQLLGYIAGYFRDADANSKVIVLWLDRVESATPDQHHIRFASMVALDSDQNEVPASGHFPTKVSYFDSYFAVVRVAESARFFYLCWDGVPAEESACDWIYGIK